VIFWEPQSNITESTRVTIIQPDLRKPSNSVFFTETAYRVHSQQRGAEIVSELKINLFSTLKIPGSLLRGASIIVVPLPRCVSSRKTWFDEEELNTVSNTKEEALITR